MKTISGICLFALFSICSYGKEWNYTISYQVSNNLSALHIVASFKGLDSNKIQLQFPDSWGDQHKFFRAVQNLKMTNAVAWTMAADSTTCWVELRPGKKLTVEYDLVQNWKGSLHYPLNYRAIINETYFQFSGLAGWIAPKLQDDELVTVNITWNLPKSWTVANSLHAGKRTFKTTLRYNDFLNSIYVGGDFRLHKKEVNKKPIWLAIRGNWQFQDTTLLNDIVTIVKMERNFWNDHTEPYYFVSLIPFQERGSSNGSVLYQSFMLAMPDDVPKLKLYQLIAHEYFHRWNYIAIKSKEGSDHIAWFGEGFTDFYSYKILHENKLIDDSSYLASVNKIIKDYYLSPLRNEKHEVLTKNFWSSNEYQQFPYRKGFVFALLLNEQIVQNSKGKYNLDDVMKELLNYGKQGIYFSDSSFVSAVTKFNGKNIQNDLKNYIYEGNTIPVNLSSLGKEYDVITNQLHAFDLGFDADSSFEKRMVLNVKENSNAYKAGLRNNQKLLGWSFSYEDVANPVKFTVQENEEKKIISYYPAATEGIPVPQFVKRFKGFIN